MAGTKIGSLVDGRFRVIDKLGEGGMSVVWLARDERLEKLWAIKEVKLNSNDGLYRANIAATRQEANIMKRLDHPALPRIVDVVDDGEGLLVVMDYVPGKDLLKLLKEKGAGYAFEEKQVIDWGIQLCDALGYLHAQNPPIIFRDMKPGNVVLQDDGTVKIIDFGIAREYKEGQTLDTKPLGTRGYAPPEAFVEGQKTQTDPRSDIYTLGVTLFHLVTGHSPMEYVTQPNLPPIRSINPALSPAFESTIIKATNWNPAERQQSCDELRYELENPEDPEERRWMLRTVSMFKGLLIAGVACIVLGVALLIAGNMVRASSYDGLIEQAKTANREEQNADEQGGDPSEAERLYTQAIGIINSDIAPYEMLVTSELNNNETEDKPFSNPVYLNDGELSVKEADRWEALFSANQGAIEGQRNYDRLCYDAAMAYFLYYGYGDDSLSGGKESVPWFQKAKEAYDRAPESWHTDNDNPMRMTEDMKKNCDVFIDIAQFKDMIERRVDEGNENDAYKNFFSSLEEAANNAQGENGKGGLAAIHQLRVYDVLFAALSSPPRIQGFRRAGITEDRVSALLNQVERQTAALQGDVTGSIKAQTLYDRIMNHASEARLAVQNQYHSAGARGETMAGGAS